MKLRSQTMGRRPRRLRFVLVLLLLVLVLPIGLQILLELLAVAPSADRIGSLRESLDGRSLGLTLLRLGVWLVVIWYGPVWRRVRPEDLDRARLMLLGVAAFLELVFVQRLFLF